MGRLWHSPEGVHADHTDLHVGVGDQSFDVKKGICVGIVCEDEKAKGYPWGQQFTEEIS